MRKRILAPGHEPSGEWLDVERLAEVELTSEDPSHPVEHALRPGGGGWRAAGAGAQVIRLRFDAPRHIRRIRLVFEEHEVARTQEFALRWSGGGGSGREIVRQQFNFSPPGTTREAESYEVDLPGVSTLELTIVPDVGGGAQAASLAEWRLASSAETAAP